MTLNNLWFYLLLMGVFAWVLFGSLGLIADKVEEKYLIPAFIIVGTLMFHHYIVDAIIWRKKKKKKQ